MLLTGISQKWAYLYAIIGNSSFAIMQLLYKHAAKTFGSFQVLCIRSFFLFLMTYSILWKNQLSVYIPSHRIFKLVTIRIGIVGGLAVIIYYCLAFLPVSAVTTLFNLGPIFIFFIEAFSEKKKINICGFVLTIISFTGVILIIQPQFIFSSQENNSLRGCQLYVFLMIVAAFMNALNAHYIYDLAKCVSPYVNMVYSHLGFILYSGILCNIDHTSIQLKQITLFEIGIMVGVIIFAFIFQYLVFLSTSLVKPSKIMPFGYVTVLFGFIGDIYFFDSKFTLLPIIGMLLTSSGLLGEYFVSQRIRQEGDSIVKQLKQQNILEEQYSKD